MKSQRGGFFLGMIVGLLIGLALALVVALYVTKVPLPFIDKVPQRTAEQDAAEAEHNRNWDPNRPLQGANPARPRPLPDPAPVEPASAPADPSAAAEAPAAEAAVEPTRDPAAILAGDPVSTESPADPFNYHVQAGAYGSSVEAEQQRARLSMMGLEPRIVEREVNGRTMYRVRLGPYPQRDQAEEIRARLSGSGIESALVRTAK